MAVDSTPFANSKKRIIHQSEKGKFYVMTKEGKKSYGPKAAFKKAANGSMKTIKANNKVPNAIAPAVRKPKAVAKKASPAGPKVRKVRSNKGVARGPREGTLQRRMDAEAKKVAARRAAVRKVRSNKGVARGPREGTLQRRMDAEAKRIAARRGAVRKVRANKGVGRAPVIRRMAKMMTPTEAELYQMIFGTPVRRPIAKKAPAKKAPAKKAPAKKTPLNRLLTPIKKVLRRSKRPADKKK
jgi:hypothetical protein